MDPHKILGIAPDASDEELKQAYRRKAAKYHPDVGGDAWAFQQVQQAYKTITNARIAKDDTAERKPTSSSNVDNPPAATNASPHRGKQTTLNPALESLRGFLAARVLNGQLMFPIETICFALINLGDILATHRLLQVGGYESNPIANYFLHHYNVKGLVAFKVVVVAIVITATQLVAHRKPRLARSVLIAGIVVVGLVVIYSLRIFPDI
jgi:hypothetical protein